MNRGSQLRDVPLPQGPQGFNEAPIHESGKSGSAHPAFGAARCFNEAPIHESGKSLCRDPLHAGRRRASMRPRFMNRGSPGRGSRVLCQTASFNEAPIHESGKS